MEDRQLPLECFLVEATDAEKGKRWTGEQVTKLKWPHSASVPEHPRGVTPC